MDILSYNQFINESRNPKMSDISKYKKEMGMLENEYLRLQSDGLSEERINENIFASFFGSLGGGFTDTFKSYIVDWAAEKFGVNPMDENGQPTFFYQLIRNIIEQAHWTEIGSYFGKGSCKNWSRAIVEGLSETLQERGIEYLLPKLGLDINTNTGMGGTIVASLREALTNAVNNTTFMNKVENMIADKICGFKLGDVISGNLTPGDKENIKGQIEAVGEKDPSIYSKAMKTGLSSILQFNK